MIVRTDYCLHGLLQPEVRAQISGSMYFHRNHLLEYFQLQKVNIESIGAEKVLKLYFSPRTDILPARFCTNTEHSIALFPHSSVNLYLFSAIDRGYHRAFLYVVESDGKDFFFKKYAKHGDDSRLPAYTALQLSTIYRSEGFELVDSYDTQTSDFIQVYE